MTSPPPAHDAAAIAEIGMCRVVKRHGIGRIWDVFDDRINDYVATMNPTLPVSSCSVAERICNSINARRASLAQSKGEE